MEKKSKIFTEKFKKFISQSQNSIKLSKLKPKSAIELLNKFKQKKDKFKPTQLGDIHKGHGVSTFQDKFSVNKAISTITAPTFAAKKLAKGAVKEGAKFTVAIFDNSPSFVKSWVRSFSGYGLAFRAAHERFDSLPEVVKIKARRSMFEIILVLVVALAFGLGFGLYYGLKKPDKNQVIRAQSEYSVNTSWNDHVSSSFPSAQRGSFTWLISQTSFLDFNQGYNQLKGFYINNFFGGNTKTGANSFYFSGIDVPSMGVSFSDDATQNLNIPKLNPPYKSPGLFPYTHYSPIKPQGVTKAHFVKYSSPKDVSKVIRENKVNEKQATNRADDLYRNNLLNAWRQPSSHFALYTLSSYRNHKYEPLSLTFTSTNDSSAPKIVENVSFVVSNCDPGTREVSSNKSNYNVQVLLTHPIGNTDPKNPNYQTNFGGVIFVNQNVFGGDTGGSNFFSQSFEFDSK